MRYIKKKWPFVGMLINKVYRMLGNQMSRVTRFRGQLQPVPPIRVPCLIDMGNKIYVSTDITYKAIKSMVNGVVVRIIAKMPFTEDARGITTDAHDFRPSDLSILKASKMSLVLFRRYHDKWYADFLLIEACH